MSERLKQDMNFLEYPLWFQNSRFAAHQDDGYVWRDRDGYVYRTGYNPPTKTDYVFLCYLLLMSQRAGWQEQIETTRYEVVKACGMVPGRVNYDRLTESLTRWQMVGLEFRGIFYDGNAYEVMQFGVLDDWDIEKKTKRLRVKFNEKWLLCIKESTFFKFLDFQEIQRLRSALSIRLYEILIKAFQGRAAWEIDAVKLAGKIPMAQEYASDITLKVRSAVKRINDHTSLTILLSVRHRERGKTVLIFEKNKAPAKTEPQNPTPCALEPGLNTVVSLVPKEERTDKTISLVSRWLDKRGPEYVRRNIEYTNQRSSKHNGYQGYLANAFEQGWAEDRPHQTNGLPNIEEGMVVEYEGAQYRVDATGCIFLTDGACMPPGLVRQKLDMGECRVVVDTSGQICS